MIIYRLLDNKEEGYEHNLENALEQPQWFLENKNLTLKKQEAFTSNGVLIFYVPRKQPAPVIPKFKTEFAFNKLPLTIVAEGFVNTSEINYSEAISLKGTQEGNELFHLKSVVALELTALPKDNKVRAIGCSALLIRNENNVTDGQYLLYDPVGAYTAGKGTGDKYYANAPVSIIDESNPLGAGEGMDIFNTSNALGFRERASKCGTIFIYAKKDLKLE
jgi:hypothetical protein